ncbi:hypothetical protein Tco_0213904 [Tanacetum coccineum]
MWWAKDEGRDDQDKDEEPSARSNRGTKRRRLGKEESSKEATQKEPLSTSSSKGTSRSQPKSSGKSAQAEEHGLKNARGRQVIPFDHFINNDLEYLKGGSLSQKYTTSLTKMKAADYGHVKWIEDKVPRRRSACTGFKKATSKDFVAKTLKICYFFLFKNVWRIYNWQLKATRRRLNLSRPDSYHLDLKKMTPYTAYHDIQGIIYQDDMDRNRLMRTDELHKFSDGTLNHVRTVLNDIYNGIQMEYLPKRKWSK